MKIPKISGTTTMKIPVIIDHDDQLISIEYMFLVQLFPFEIFDAFTSCLEKTIPAKSARRCSVLSSADSTIHQIQEVGIE